MLEKSRVVTHLPEERSFHVFYELLDGLRDEEKEKYGLQTAEKYFYLNQGGSTALEGKCDSDDFQSLLAAMQVLGLSVQEQDNVFRILATGKTILKYIIVLYLFNYFRWFFVNF